MKTSVKIAGIFTVLVLSAGISQAGNFVVDNVKSSVKWNGKKVTGEHYGTISIKKGEIEVKNNAISGAKVEIDMNTIVVEDVKDAGTNGKLTGHLKSEDFFGVEKFPVSSLVLTGVKKLSGDNYEFTGDLTIKGITHPVTFTSTSTLKGNSLYSTGKITVNRARYDIRYGSGSFFQGLGDKMIYDDFTLEFNLVAAESK